MDSPDTENINAVWRRVTERAPEREVFAEDTPSGERLLAALVNTEERGRAAFLRLAGLTKSRPAAELFKKLAAEHGRNAGLLQTEYFLRTGDTFPAAPRRIKNEPLLPALRSRWTEELEAAASLEKAAKTDASLAGLLADLAAEGRDRAGKVRQLIERAIKGDKNGA